MLPIILNPTYVSVVIFGYGKASQMKVQGIARSGIQCYVVSPSIDDQGPSENIHFVCDHYAEKHLEKGQLVIAATDSKKLNDQIMLDARRLGKMVLNLSDGDKSDFHMMSWRNKGTVTLGLSTGNCAPKESIRLIETLMETIDDETVDRIELLGKLRRKIKALGYKPVKPIINRMTTLSMEALKELEALSLDQLATEIKKDM